MIEAQLLLEAMRKFVQKLLLRELRGVEDVVVVLDNHAEFLLEIYFFVGFIVESL